MTDLYAQLAVVVDEHNRLRHAAAYGRQAADDCVRAVMVKFAPMRANVEHVRALEAAGKWPPHATAVDPQAPMIDPQFFNDPLGLRRNKAD